MVGKDLFAAGVCTTETVGRQVVDSDGCGKKLSRINWKTSPAAIVGHGAPRRPRHGHPHRADPVVPPGSRYGPTRAPLAAPGSGPPVAYASASAGAAAIAALIAEDAPMVAS